MYDLKGLNFRQKRHLPRYHVPFSAVTKKKRATFLDHFFRLLNKTNKKFSDMSLKEELPFFSLLSFPVRKKRQLQSPKISTKILKKWHNFPGLRFYQEENIKS